MDPVIQVPQFCHTLILQFSPVILLQILFCSEVRLSVSKVLLHLLMNSKLVSFVCNADTITHQLHFVPFGGILY